jgi:hypothetical protein
MAGNGRQRFGRKLSCEGQDGNGWNHGEGNGTGRKRWKELVDGNRRQRLEGNELKGRMEGRGRKWKDGRKRWKEMEGGYWKEVNGRTGRK